MRFALAVLASFLLLAPVTAQDRFTSEEHAILEALKDTPIPFSVGIPPGEPDPSEWPGFDHQISLKVGGPKTGKDQGEGLAIVLIREGLCSDSDETCYLGLRYEISEQEAAANGTLLSAVHYAFRSQSNKKLEGFVVARDPDGVYTFWGRTDGDWKQRPKHSPEYKADMGLVGWLFPAALQAEARNPHPKPRPAPRTIAQ